MNELLQVIDQLEKRIERLEAGAGISHYKGTSAIDFTTTTLPRHGDYGFQTTDKELQINCNGTIRRAAMSPLQVHI